MGQGNCIIDFNDPGNTNYLAAAQVQQSITVTAGAPAGADIQGLPSPQDGKPDNGDALQFSFNQTMMASSFLSGFTGASTSVVVQLTRQSGNPTMLQVCQSMGCGTVVNLGTVSLGDTTSGSRYDSSSGTTITINAIMLMSTVNGESVVTVTLGTVANGSNSPSAISPTASTTLTWTPSSTAKSSGGASCTTAGVTESGSPKLNF